MTKFTQTLKSSKRNLFVRRNHQNTARKTLPLALEIDSLFIVRYDDQVLLFQNKLKFNAQVILNYHNMCIFRYVGVYA